MVLKRILELQVGLAGSIALRLFLRDIYTIVLSG